MQLIGNILNEAAPSRGDAEDGEYGVPAVPRSISAPPVAERHSSDSLLGDPFPVNLSPEVRAWCDVLRGACAGGTLGGWRKGRGRTFGSPASQGAALFRGAGGRWGGVGYWTGACALESALCLPPAPGHSRLPR